MSAKTQINPAREDSQKTMAARVVAASLSLACLIFAGFFCGLVARQIAKKFVLLQQAAVIDELAAIGEFRKSAVANRNSAKIAYAKTTSDGLGIFVKDLLSDKTIQLDTLAPPDNGGNFFSLPGWSPDGRYLIYGSEITSSQSRDYRLIICDGESLGFLDAIHINHPSVDYVSWNNTNTFILTAGNQLFEWTLIAGSSGRYAGKETALVKVFPGKDESNAMCYIPDTGLAYRNGRALMVLSNDLTEAELLRLPDNSKLEWLTSDLQGQHLLFAQENSTNQIRALFRVDIKTKTLHQLSSQSENVYNGRWLGDGGYAYVGNVGNTNYLAVCLASGIRRTNFIEGSIRAYSVSPDGQSIFVTGSQTFGPPSIWRCDVKKGAIDEVVAAAEKDVARSEVIQPLKGNIEFPDGTFASYYMLPPRNFDHKKKYPVVIDGPTESRWQAHSQLIANSGAYYISVNRRGLASSDRLETAKADIWAVYQSLLHKPNIDPHQIYLNGFSHSTSVVSALLKEHPGAWKGAMLMSPGVLPEINEKTADFPKILISFGDEDISSRSSGVYRFEDQACAKLVDIKIVMHKDEGHIFLSNSATRERMKAVADFLY